MGQLEARVRYTWLRGTRDDGRRTYARRGRISIKPRRTREGILHIRDLFVVNHRVRTAGFDVGMYQCLLVKGRIQRPGRIVTAFSQGTVSKCLHHSIAERYLLSCSSTDPLPRQHLVDRRRRGPEPRPHQGGLAGSRRASHRPPEVGPGPGARGAAQALYRQEVRRRDHSWRIRDPEPRLGSIWVYPDPGCERPAGAPQVAR